MITRQQYTLLKMTCSKRKQNTSNVNCHIVCKKLEDKIVVAKDVSSGHQLADFLTKGEC